MGGEILGDGGTPDLPLPQQGPRTLCLSGCNCEGGEELRGEAVGHLQLPIQEASSGPEGPEQTPGCTMRPSRAGPGP